MTQSLRQRLKQRAVRAIRAAGLIEAADRARFALDWLKRKRRNDAYRRAHPDTSFPPPYMLYESFGKLDFRAWDEGGRESARAIADLIAAHIPLDHARICEWGCGPARLLRHMPEFTGPGAELHGTDCNAQTIDWCARTFPGIEFRVNGLLPPLPFGEGCFDVLYGISVLTHLSEEAQKLWVRECLRVLRPGGVCLLTVHGDAVTDRLVGAERAAYETRGCVVRSGAPEGKRTFTAYDSPDYMRSVLFRDRDIAAFIPGTGGEQDMWIVRKLEQVFLTP